MFIGIFIEAENPSNAHIILDNGGPGCSGLIGLFHELGPYRPIKNGKISYNLLHDKLVNIVFMEQLLVLVFMVHK